MQILKKNDPLTVAYLELTKKMMQYEKKESPAKVKNVEIDKERMTYLKEMAQELGVPEVVVLNAEYNIMKSYVENFKV